MRDYKKILFKTIRNNDYDIKKFKVGSKEWIEGNEYSIAEYFVKKLKSGKAIIQILVDEDNNEICELISYGNDKKKESYYKYLMNGGDEIEDFVIYEYMAPVYNFKESDNSSNSGFADIDIFNDYQDYMDFSDFKREVVEMQEICRNGDSFKFEDTDDSSYHYEFFLSINQGDVANIGGPMELDFIEQWMIEKGYYIK